MATDSQHGHGGYKPLNIAKGRPRPYRERLPNKRPVLSSELDIGNGVMITVSVGFDKDQQPAEIFLSGAKDGSGLAAILDDVSVVVSVALQHGVPAAALAKSVARLPDLAHVLEPAGDASKRPAASIVGKVLDLLTEYEKVSP